MPKAGYERNHQLGRTNSHWKGGVHLSDKGYPRFSSGPHRSRYVHRVVIAELCREWCYYPLDPKSGIPSGFTVEHVDHNRRHYCHQNLLLLQLEIHNALSWRSWLNRDTVGEVAGQERPTLGPDDFDPEIAGPGRRYIREELDEVPF